MKLLSVFLCACMDMVVNGLPRGIPRSLEPSYASASQFMCLDGSKTIPAARVNDDFCDCTDGSDEPGTSACSNGRFYCINKGSRGKFIHSGLVVSYTYSLLADIRLTKYVFCILQGDGICDCCDGSDEWATPRGKAGECKNTCDAEGADWRRTQADAIKKAEEGARLRASYEDVGSKATQARAVTIATTTDAVAVATAIRDSAQAAVAAAEAAEAIETARLRAASEAAESAGVSTANDRMAAALGISDLDRSALLALFLTHVRDTGTSVDLVTALQTAAVAAGRASGG
jgi:protein kinase C substrate 80K-H